MLYDGFFGNDHILRFFAPLLIPLLIAAILLFTSVFQIGLFYNRYKPPIYDTKKLSDDMFRRLILVPKIMFISYGIVYSGVIPQNFSAWIFLLLTLILLFNLLAFFSNFDAVFSRMKKGMEAKHFRTNFKNHRKYEDWKNVFRASYEKENPSSQINSPHVLKGGQFYEKGLVGFGMEGGELSEPLFLSGKPSFASDA